ncbi:MAG: alpha/beta hydrolase [Conexibacter sp.]|nr:alpha/beta hydrolase [Conexibacter sp.]
MSTRAGAAYEVQEVSFLSDGVKVAAELWVPAGAGGPRAGIVVGHGTSMVKEALVGPARHLCEAGLVVLSIDYRSFGLSDGEPRRAMFPRREVDDFRSAISYLRRRPEVDAERIGIWGVSFAGGVVLHTAALDRRVKAVVAQSPTVDGRRWIRELRSGFAWEQLLTALEEDRERRDAGEEGARVPYASPEGMAVIPVMLPPGFAPDPADPNPVRNPGQMETWDPMLLLESIERIIDFNPTDVIDMIAPRPLLIVTNSGHDEVHLLTHVQDAYKRAGEPKEMVLLDYDSFGLYEGEGLAEAMGIAAAFFHRHLNGAAPEIGAR